VPHPTRAASTRAAMPIRVCMVFSKRKRFRKLPPPGDPGRLASLLAFRPTKYKGLQRILRSVSWKRRHLDRFAASITASWQAGWAGMAGRLGGQWAAANGSPGGNA
jgi:hypothetical protein